MKRGATHVGLVLSFVIFIVFLVFLITAIEPSIRAQSSKQILLDSLRLNLLDVFIIEDLTITTIHYKGDPSNPIKDCIKDNIGGTKLEGIITDENKDHLKIIDENGNVVDYDFQGGSNLFKIDLDPLNIRDSTDDVLLKIYHSNEILSATSSITGCKNIETDEVIDIGQIKEEQEIIFESKIRDLVTQYESEEGYENLKTQLGIPLGSEFWFSFELADGTKIEPEEVIIPNTNVYATVIPTQYLDNDASLQIGFLTIVVW